MCQRTGIAVRSVAISKIPVVGIRTLAGIAQHDAVLQLAVAIVISVAVIGSHSMKFSVQVTQKAFSRITLIPFSAPTDKIIHARVDRFKLALRI